MDSENVTPGPRPAPVPAEYETCAPGSLPAAQMAVVRVIQEKFVRILSEELAHRLEVTVTGQLSGSEPVEIGAFLGSGSEGGCFLTLEAEPVRGQAYAFLSAGFVAFLLKVLLGAPAMTEGPRNITEIEMHILRELFEMVARELSAAWKPVGVGFKWTSSATPEAGAAGQGTVLVFDCRLNLEGAEETVRIAVPAFLARLAALQATPAASEAGSPAVRGKILDSLRRASVNVEAVISGSKLRMRDLVALESGHVLMLSQAAGSPVECRINGKAKFQGEWISRGNRGALELL